MTSIWKKLAWSVFALSLFLAIWYVESSLLAGEAADLCLFIAFVLAVLICLAIHVLLKMRPAYRWLTIASAVGAVIFGLQSLARGGPEISIWLVLPGFFGFVWLRYIFEFRDGDFESLSRQDVCIALAITLAIVAFTMVMMAAPQYFLKRAASQNPVAQELIESE